MLSTTGCIKTNLQNYFCLIQWNSPGNGKLPNLFLWIQHSFTISFPLTKRWEHGWPLKVINPRPGQTEKRCNLQNRRLSSGMPFPCLPAYLPTPFPSCSPLPPATHQSLPSFLWKSVHRSTTNEIHYWRKKVSKRERREPLSQTGTRKGETASSESNEYQIFEFLLIDALKPIISFL